MGRIRLHRRHDRAKTRQLTPIVGILNRDDQSDQLGAILAMSAGPDAPWPAALWRSATALCLLGLVLLAAEDLLFEDVPDPQEAAGDAGA